MASGNIYGTTDNIYIQSAIIWSATADEKLNQSYVTATLCYKRSNEFVTSGTGTFSIAIDGKTVASQSKYMSIGSSWVEAITVKKWVGHNSDGSKSITISASGNIPETTLTGTSCSGTVTLDKISNATTIDSLTCDTKYLDGLITYKYTPQSSFYTRANISLNLDGTYLQIHSNNHGIKTAGTQQSEGVRFTSSELSKIYAALPKTTTGTIRVTIRTYKDSSYSNQVGDASHKDISLSIPTAVKPTASLTVSPVNDNAWIKEKNIYVAGYSGLSATLSATAGEGASMSSYSIAGGDYSSNSSKLSVNKISASGNIALTGKAVDSRGRSGSANKTITVHPYSTPAITSLTIERGTYSSKWTADENGPDVKVVFKTALALTNYSNTYKADFLLNGTAKTPSSGTTTGLASGTTYTVYFQNIDGESSHSLKISATDSVGDTGTATITIPTVNVTIEFNASGKGIAFGKTSEKEAFECAWDAEFSGSLAKKRTDGSLIELDDTGWISMGTSSNVSATDASDTGRNGPGCYYRVINKRHVYVAFNVAFTFSGAAIVVNTNTLPSALRPTRKAYAMSLVSGRAFARTGVNTAGNVIIDWVQNIDTTDTTQSATTTWIDGYIDYWIE